MMAQTHAALWWRQCIPACLHRRATRILAAARDERLVPDLRDGHPAASEQGERASLNEPSCTARRETVSDAHGVILRSIPNALRKSSLSLVPRLYG